MRAGAFDFAVKPVAPDRLRTLLDKCPQGGGRRSGKRFRRRETTVTAGTGFEDFVGRSAAMERVLRLARKAAGSDIPVLVEGESGVGKELVARAVHAGSARRARPFVTVNCGAIPENLVESILFGHEKGSFTGATEKHVGKFVEADGGTLFLDEVGELPPSAQVQAPARRSGWRDRPGRCALDGKGGSAHHFGDPSRHAADGQGQRLPRGPLLPPARLPPDPRAGAAHAP